jgi:hypothetical protein
MAFYDYYNKAGFNPETDMLQCPGYSSESYTYRRKDWFQGEPNMAKFLESRHAQRHCKLTGTR